MAPARIYLDHNATAPIRPDVLSVVTDVLACVGNPSSVHAEGRKARALVERARAQVAALVGARPEDVIFTSGGTEANATALRPGAVRNCENRPVERLLASAAEHASVLGSHGFLPESFRIVPVDADGRLDLDALSHIIEEAGGEPLCLSVQMANNETGVLQPVAAAAAKVRSAGGVVHTDAVQAAGRIPIDMVESGVDALTLSGHKLGAPSGVGALVLASGRAGPGLPLLRGGGQESRMRAGTENLFGIVGFGIAAELAVKNLESEAARLRALRDETEGHVRRVAPAAVVFGADVERIPNTLAFAVPGLSAETALMSLDLDGIAVSSGAACSSGKVGRSHVLAAMGVPDELARGAIRVSFGWNSCEADVLRFVQGFETLLHRLYEPRPARAA